MSLLFYLCFLGVLLSLCKSNGSGNQKNRILFAYFLLFFISATRFNIGNDYEDYVSGVFNFIDIFKTYPSIIDAYNQRTVHSEIAFVFLIKLFQYFPRPYVWVFATYSLINTYLLYLILRRVQGHYWGLYIFVISEFLFISWDMIRQATAVMLCFYAIILLREDYFVKKGGIIKYELCVLLATLFHTTALIMAPFFFLRWLKINKWILISILVLTLLLMWSGILAPFQERIAFYATFIDDYEGYAINDATLLVAESTMYKLRLTLYTLLWVQILFFLPEKENVLRFCLTLGGALFIFAMNSLTFMRLSWYFLIVLMIALPIAISNVNIKLYRQFLKWTLFAMLLLFSIDVIRDSNVRGCGTYKSIFSSDFINERVNSRELQNSHD